MEKMDKRTLTGPVCAMVLEGDTKSKVATCKHTYLASYESHQNKTLVFVKVTPTPRNGRKTLIKSLKDVYKNYGKILSVEYHSEDVDFYNIIK